MQRELRFERLPALPLLYARGVLDRRRRPGSPFQPRIPALDASVGGVALDRTRLERFRQICGAPGNGPIPLTYPHVVATPLQAALVMDEAFPYPVLGVVHVRQIITQHRAIRPSARLAIHCRLGEEREARRGVEFDTITEVRTGGDLVWESVATALVPGRSSPSRSKAGPRPAPTPHDHEESWDLPADLGRRYARITHDFNPIHLWPATARVFGFRRPIIHGMWSVARVVAALGERVPADAVSLDVAFRRPVPLPSTVRLCWSERDDGIELALRTADGSADHLRGWIRPAP